MCLPGILTAQAHGTSWVCLGALPPASEGFPTRRDSSHAGRLRYSPLSVETLPKNQIPPMPMSPEAESSTGSLLEYGRDFRKNSLGWCGHRDGLE